ncbi:MAG TPA: FAD-binding oxidoreductase [Gemmatimonadales bacterium]|nr:FAD-binding oxidoreductase [Gemmatimonadales bacterium]
MSHDVLHRLRALLGDASVSRDPDGIPRAVPDSAEGVAATLRLADQAGWRVRLEGHGSWVPPDAQADLALTTRGLDRIVSVKPADLVATVEAGVPMDGLQRRLADDGMWLALDPPGRPDRTIGSVVATATAGALRAGYGPVRDHVLGCTVVTGDGRLIHPGGTVVKNVAGYDLTKLQVGGFGAFGVLSTLHLRLRALPAAEATLVARAPRDHLTSAARDVSDAGVQPHALELLSPAVSAEPEWTLAARCVGSPAGVAAEKGRILDTADLPWEELPPERAHAFWHLVTHAGSGAAMTLRLGVLAPGLDEMLDLLGQQLDEGLVWAGASQGGMRWAGDAEPDRVRTLRNLAAEREVPLTLERAPWAVRQAVGHFGAYREGVGPLVTQLREVFDPTGRLVVAMDGLES